MNSNRETLCHRVNVSTFRPQFIIGCPNTYEMMKLYETNWRFSSIKKTTPNEHTTKSAKHERTRELARHRNAAARPKLYEAGSAYWRASDMGRCTAVKVFI